MSAQKVVISMMDNPPPAAAPFSGGQVKTIRGQYHKFMPIPMIERHSRWFDAGPVSIAVEARALGDAKRMVRGPSIHVCGADHTLEYLRFDVFGSVLHYHYLLNDVNHNILWGYDQQANGPMIPWVINALRDRLSTLLRGANAHDLAKEVDCCGWDTSVLPAVLAAATEALAPSADDLIRAKEGIDWMNEWKRIHPQFNTVEEGEF